ncbi:MAG: hypothetical protein KDB27_09795, partial [Planctomycetales bacterium]|nr:hypothetical protein [Planctomycetales bacterium]
MIPQTYTSQFLRPTLCTYVCVIGLAQTAGCVLESRLYADATFTPLAILCIACIFCETVLFGYRAFLPGWMLAFVVRLGSLPLMDSASLAARDLVGGAILAFAWHYYQRSKPLDEQPLSTRDLESVLSAISDASFVFDGNGKYLEIFTANPQLVVRPVKALLGKR